MSNIHVSVQWKSSTVFAGEDIECTITFKNVSQSHDIHHLRHSNLQLRSHGRSREWWKESFSSPIGNATPGAEARNWPPSSGSARSQIRTRGQECSRSHLNRSFEASSLNTQDSLSHDSSLGENKHRRSVSIVSIGSEKTLGAAFNDVITSSGKPVHTHARAASLHGLPRMSRSLIASPSSGGHNRTFTVPSPLFRSSTSFAEKALNMHGVPRPKHQANFSLISPIDEAKDHKTHSALQSPQTPTSRREKIHQNLGPAYEVLPSSTGMSSRSPNLGTGFDQILHTTKVLSPGSTGDTPRSSGENYSVSNYSNETLASEYIAQENSRLPQRSMHGRQNPHLSSVKESNSETLMMGYSQIVGSFTLDGSLINQNLFEDVKKKGIVGAQGGGGVVRNESTKPDSGLLGSLGWGKIGDSIGGLLGSHGPSSIKEYSSSASPKSIPILSTPQTILFVDLKLKSGESKSFTYKHTLPKGIPPTHRGRAIKVSYSLIVGTQRPAKVTHQHQVQQADIPFRVLTGVNEQGEILGHNLMSPHTFLSSRADAGSFDDQQQAFLSLEKASSLETSTSSTTNLYVYIEKLLDSAQINSRIGLLSPTEADSKSVMPVVEEPPMMKQSIDLAILRSNVVGQANRCPNRFEITRSGDRIAVIMLARPAYRLGETIPIAIDFQDSSVSCYSLHASLETLESIDPAIALRSKASIQRATKRVHASQTECTIFAQRIFFNPLIPMASTPAFITSGICLDWKLRFRFVTSSLSGTQELQDYLESPTEELARDERGIVKAAVQGLSCDSFEVTVPVRVYGYTVGSNDWLGSGDFPI